MTNRTDILIIGGGASGMAAAIEAARMGASVRILEKKEQLGKKLLKTGNGRCNYSNFYLTERNYRTHDKAFVKNVLHTCHTESLINWFESLGMLSMAKDRYLYPATNRAETVVSVLTKELKRLHVSVVLNADVTGIRQEDHGFLVTAGEETYSAGKVILSAGTEASVSDQRPFTAPEILSSFGHHLYPFDSALTELIGDESVESIWDGVRVNASIRFREETEEGELQLTKQGLSGIPAFQVSRFVSNALSGGENATVFINFLPSYDEAALTEILSSLRQHHPEDLLKDALEGWLAKKLVLSLVKKQERLFRSKLDFLSDSDLNRVVSFLTSFPYRVRSVGTKARSQVLQGGLDLSEITHEMESKLVPGLYVTGELLDVDGMCGGYNLHFAFATGRIAGRAAAKNEAAT